MRVRALDKNHDWTFGQNRQNYLTESACIYQNVNTRLQSFENDWFLDMDHGLPWLEAMEKPADMSRIESMVKLQVLQTEGVATLDEFSLNINPNTRKLKVELRYTDIYGQTQEVSRTPMDNKPQ